MSSDNGLEMNDYSLKGAFSSFFSRNGDSDKKRQDGKPAIDIPLQGTKYEQLRLKNLIDTVAVSPTAKKILEDAKAAGYTIALQNTKNCYGKCDAVNNVLYLNPSVPDEKLATTLVHEARHAQQHTRGTPNNVLQYDVATELKLRRATEADAQAAALQAALEIRAATKDSSILNAFEKSDRNIVSAVAVPPLSASLEEVCAAQAVNMQAAFKGWFKEKRIIDAYEESYLVKPLKYVYTQMAKDSSFCDKVKMNQSLDSKAITEMVCVAADGRSYFEKTPDVLDKTPEMCGMRDETRKVADTFFKARQDLTGAPKDTSYDKLPSRDQNQTNAPSPAKQSLQEKLAQIQQMKEQQSKASARIAANYGR